MKAHSTARRILAAMILAVMAVFLVPQVASASTPPTQVFAASEQMQVVSAGVFTSSDGIIAPGLSTGDTGQKAAPKNNSDGILPVSRWTDVATGLHWRGEGGASKIISDLGTRIQRDATSPLYLSIGHTAWSWSTAMTTAATNFDILEPLGERADEAAALLGNALFDSGIIVLLIAITFVAVFLRARKGGLRLKPLARGVLVVGLLAAMVAGAQNSNTVNGEFRPGTMSPGWVAVQTNTLVSSLTSAPAAAISFNSDTFQGAGDPDGPAASCSAYVAELESAYKDAVTPNYVELPKFQSSIPLIMSRMWESTGLEAWKVSQFGRDNTYGDFMYCRYLEQRANVTPQTQEVLTNRAGGVPQTNINSAAWKTNGDNEHEDRNLIAWAMCRPDGAGWKIDGDWKQVERKVKPNAEACAEWWSTDYFTGESGSDAAGPIADGKGAFEYRGSIQDTMNDTKTAPAARDFLLSLHGPGSAAGANIALVMSYMLSAIVLFFVFGAISLGIFIAKVAAVIMIIATPFALLKDMLPGDGPSQTVKFFKSFLGFTFLAYGVQLIFALIALITGFLTTEAVEWWGGASIIAMVWTGAAPLIAVIVLNLLFTKVLKLPSPLSINGGQAWAKAAGGGAIGGAMGAGLTNAAMNRGKGFARSAASGAGHAVASRTGISRLNGGGAKKVVPSGFSNRSATTSATTADAARAGVAASPAVAAAAGGAAGVAGASVVNDRAARKAGKKSDVTPSGLNPENTAQLTPKQQAKEEARQLRKIERAEFDEATQGKSQAEIRGEIREARKAERDARVEARGYKGGVLGDVRENITRKISDNVAAMDERTAGENLKAGGKFAGRSIRKVAKVGARVGGAGLAVAATGGLALPVIAAAALYKGGKRTYRSVQGRQDGDRRRIVAASSKRAAEAAQQRQSVTEKHDRRTSQRQFATPTPARRAPGETTFTGGPTLPQPQTSNRIVPEVAPIKIPGVSQEEKTTSGLILDSRTSRRMSQPTAAPAVTQPVNPATGSGSRKAEPKKVPAAATASAAASASTSEQRRKELEILGMTPTTIPQLTPEEKKARDFEEIDRLMEGWNRHDVPRPDSPRAPRTPRLRD